MAEDMSPRPGSAPPAPAVPPDAPEARRAAWCPLSGLPCRRDCAWAALGGEMADDGFYEEVLCAVAVIAGHFLGAAGLEEV